MVSIALAGSGLRRAGGQALAGGTHPLPTLECQETLPLPLQGAAASSPNILAGVELRK